MKLHERLNNYIAEHGIKQVWVAEKAGISVKTLNAILHGRQRLTADMFELICRSGLGIDPSFFFKDQLLVSKKEITSPTMLAAGGE